MVKHARHTYPHESTEGDSVTARTYGICLRLVIIAGAVRRFDGNKYTFKVYQWQAFGVYFNKPFRNIYGKQQLTGEKKPPRWAVY